MIDEALEAGPQQVGERAPSPGKSAWRHVWIVGAGVYLFFLWWIGWNRLAPVLASVDALSLLAMAGAMVFSLCVRVVKWRVVLGPDLGAAGLYFLAKAGGDWSPGRVGELAPLMLRRYRSARFGAWIVTDRLLEMAATLGLGAVGIVGYGLISAGPMPQARLYNMLFYVCLAVAVLVAAPAVLLTRRNFFIRLGEWLQGRAGLRRLGRAALLLGDVSVEVRGFGTKLPMASALTVLATSLDIIVGMLLFRSFGYSLSFLLLAVVQCAHALASTIPFTPNATGVPYLVGAGVLYKAAGIPVDVLGAGVGVSVAVTNIVFWSAFAVGVRGVRRQKKPAAGQDAVFDRLAAGDTLYAYSKESLSRLNALVPDKGRLLDIGCGDGAIAAGLDAGSVAGFDISPRCAQLAAGRGVLAAVADARAPLPYLSEAFDTVYCVDVLHHLPREAWPGLVVELRRVLKPAGRLAVVEPDARYAFVRWTQAPWSPVRVAPCADEPAIDPAELEPVLAKSGFRFERRPIRIDGEQVCRSVFPLWQRLLKAPFVIALAMWHGKRPNKFAILCEKEKSGIPPHNAD